MAAKKDFNGTLSTIENQLVRLKHAKAQPYRLSDEAEFSKILLHKIAQHIGYLAEVIDDEKRSDGLWFA